MAKQADFAGNAIDPIVAVIPNGTKPTGAIDIRGVKPLKLVIPAAFTSTALNFNGSTDGVNWQPLYDASNALIALTVAQGRDYPLDGYNFYGWPFLQIAGGTNEAADRSLTILAGRP